MKSAASASPGDRPSRVDPLLTRRGILLGGIVAGASLLAACSAATSGKSAPVSTTPTPTPSSTGGSASATPTTPSASASGSAAASSTAPATGSPVTVQSFLGDGAVVGVGMPLVLSFTPAPTDVTGFEQNARVLVNGKPVNGAWYWERPYADEPVQAHYRTSTFWPAHATVKLELDLHGVSAGKGLVFRDQLTSVTFHTGDSRITTVNGAAERADVVVNGKHVRTMKASLGKSSTPTYNGIKVVMQKGEYVPGTRTLRPDGAVRMQNTAHTYDLMVDWSVRITTSGEYMHAAPWNSEIGQVSTSDGCTNLSTADAEWYYKLSNIGDVVIHENTGGTKLPVWDGFGDWNVPWSVWKRGGPLKPV